MRDEPIESQNKNRSLKIFDVFVCKVSLNKQSAAGYLKQINTVCWCRYKFSYLQLLLELFWHCVGVLVNNNVRSIDRSVASNQ